MHKGDDNDPYVMYLIIRESLSMSSGKIGAQCAHGAQIVLMNYYRINKMSSHLINDVDQDEPELMRLSENLRNMQAWLNSRIRKVVLKANDKEWEKIKKEFEKLKLSYPVVAPPERKEQLKARRELMAEKKK